MRPRKYAEVSWIVQDISDKAKEDEIELTKNEARSLLASIEARLEDVMISAGWSVIQNALTEFQLSRRPQPLTQPRSTEFGRLPAKT
jgi:hypothetical protein